MKIKYNKKPKRIIQGKCREINVFDISGDNIDEKVVKDFGDEWLRFNEFSDKRLTPAIEEYFDILNDTIVNKNSYAIDIGCGSGRWTKFLANKAGFIEAVDPSNAVFAADELLNGIDNVRITQASVSTLPFDDETFDFAMSIGVLHHVPNTAQAMIDCVKKVKRGGYFYTYLYYSMEHRGLLFRSSFRISDFFRKIISKLPAVIKKFVCNVIAIVIYLPLVSFNRFLRFIGLTRLADKMPLASYHNKSFFIMRNDAFDRFGTRLEHRFTKKEIEDMMRKAGLTDIVFSSGVPYWHAVGKRC